MIDESAPWALDIYDVYYNIALVGKEQICANLKNDIMVSIYSDGGGCYEWGYIAPHHKLLYVYGRASEND